MIEERKNALNQTQKAMFSLKGKVAIVTGALGLLGRQHCQALAEAGAVVVVTDTDKAKCRAFAKSLSEQAQGYDLDVTNRDAIRETMLAVKRRFGHIDILVNNAAINDMFESPELAPEQSRFENYPFRMWQRSLDINLSGLYNCAQIIGSDMAGRGRGSMINIASTYGMVAPDQSLYQNDKGEQMFYKSPAYPATKSAVLGLTRYLAAYWGRTGLRVNALSPGGVQNNQDETFIANYGARTPLGRMASAQDYRGALVFLASDASAYMTGANLVVDGGWTAW